MAQIKRLKRGLDINIIGNADSTNVSIDKNTDIFAISPSDFPGITWKLSIKLGDRVMIGSPILHGKESEKIFLTSPVSGEIDQIIRGERRKIEYVIIKSDKKEEHISFSKPQSKDEAIDLLCKSGLWSMMRQRPYDIIPNPKANARDIFITSFDSAPLAQPIMDISDIDYLEEGIKLLSQLTTGKIYLGVKFSSGISSSIAKVTEYHGPHPCGNVGIQIANTKPVNKGETVFTLDAATAIRIGKLLITGKLDTTTKVAITGPLARNPHIIQTKFGAAIQTILNDEIKLSAHNPRIISGNVLTGIKVGVDNDFLHFPYRQITIIEEGNDADEFMGWASMNPNKYSVKHSFPAFLKGLKKPFNFDARINGGHRAMIVSGEYDKVFPMDIYPEFLIRAIMNEDIDKMEQLGIYEVAPEDFALAEFVDTSKLPLQEIVRNGLETLRIEIS